MLDGAVDLARDRELVERCQGGDEGSFAELYDRYHRRLLRFCLRRVHSVDDAEEAVQEAFTRAWRAMPHFGGERRFYPWLTVIAGNVCTDMLRRRARVVPMDEMPQRGVEMKGDDVDEQLLRQVDLAMATEALAHLSDRHQRVLRLRESTEWSAQRIAESEGVAVPAVDTLLWRARQAFKREFAVLSDASGLAGILGFALAAVRRTLARIWLRASTHLPAQMRGPGAIAATVALSGAAIAGGSVALVSSGSAPQRVRVTNISSTAGVRDSSGHGTKSTSAGMTAPSSDTNSSSSSSSSSS
ncbi:MAG TPA: RNA polymerase sigma factor, partial [Acidimicrobiales bacterium]|nr:RNA polymerase sigma factor [Acidimicrobiales bacterium]